MKKTALSIRLKLWLFMVVLALSFSGILYVFNQLSQSEHKDETLSTLEQLKGNVIATKDLQRDFLLNDANSEAFMKTGSSNVTEKIKHLFLTNDRLLTELENKQEILLLNGSKNLHQLEMINQHLAQNQQTFNELVAKIKSRGLINTGLVSELKTQKNELLERINVSNQPALSTMISKLNDAETNYLISKSPESLAELISIAQTGADLLSNDNNLLGKNTGLSTDEKLLLYEGMQKYTTLAKEIMETDLQIGNIGQGGLSEEVNVSAQKASVNLNAVSNYLRLQIKNNAGQKINILTYVLWALLIVPLILALIQTFNVIRSVQLLKNFSSKLAKGQFPKIKKRFIRDEINTTMQNFSALVEGLKSKVNFANKIGHGDYHTSLELSSQNDMLGKALTDMQKKLQKAEAENNERKEKEEKHNWITKGLAKFGDILRKNNENLDVFGDEVIKNLVEYLKANQGGLFVYNDDNGNEPFMELLASYAYDRKKFLEKRIELKEGLVGTCAIEKKTIHLTEIPQDYVEITSGLGKANPKSLLIVPLIFNEEIFGVIEVASLKEFEDHHIEFVEEVSENIASTLSTVKVNIRTSELLEKTRKQAEELAAAEEEMRQNVEELTTTQEEMQRQKTEMEEANKKLTENEKELTKTLELAEEREKELNEKSAQLAASEEELRQNLEEAHATQEDLIKKNDEVLKMKEAFEKEKYLLDALLNHMPDAIYFKDLQSRFLRNSKSMAKLFNVKDVSELYGKSDFDFFGDHAQQAFNDEQQIIRTGKPILDLIEKEDLQDGTTSWVSTTKLPLRDQEGNIVGTFGISRNITKSKEAEMAAAKRAEELVQSEEELRQNLEEMQTIQENFDKLQAENEKLKNQLNKK